MAYACVRTDNMSGTILGANLVSAKFYDGEAQAEIENGSVVLVGELLEGREVRKATVPATNSPLKKCALVASPEVVKEKKNNTLAEFINKEGSIIRCYRFDGFFSVTKEAFADGAELAVGNVVELNGTTKFAAVAEASGNTKVGTIFAIEGDYYVVEVDAE